MTTPNLEALIGYCPSKIETMTQAELAPIASCLDKLDAILTPLIVEAERVALHNESARRDVTALSAIFAMLSDLHDDLRIDSALSRRDELLTEAEDRHAAEDAQSDYHASLGVKTSPPSY